MHPKNQNTQQRIKELVHFAAKTNRFFTFGLGTKQWLACFLICILLLPVFSVPIGGSGFYPRERNEANPFEPVNEQLPVWTAAWRNLNAALEAWTTPFRAENLFSGDGDDRKKKKKDAASEENKDKNVAAAATSRKNTDSKTAERETTESKIKNKNSVKTRAKTSAPASPFVNELPAEERGSIYSYQNNPATLPSKTEPDSSNRAATLQIKHRPGVASFAFQMPLASLSGRGINAGIDTIYNSRTWNKSQNANNQDHYTYDVEQSWLAPGFFSGFGHLQSEATLKNAGTGGNNDWHTEIVPYGITDADGGRHLLDCKTYITVSGTQRCSVYATTDGTLLEFAGKGWIDNPNNSTTPVTTTYGTATWKTTYPDGTKVFFSGGMGSGTLRKHYPVVIQDRNGNRFRIAYKDDSGRIDYIIDTLNRQIKFYYETGSPDKLVTITIPGMGTNEEIQTVRFYYETMQLSSAGKFVGEITAPSYITVLRYVYMPATKSGYRYDYHSNYGMIKKITRFVGMEASSTSTSSTGTIQSDGLFAASTEYDFPDGSTALTDVPKYTKRTDDWQGRTSSSPQETFYSVYEDQGNLVSTITVKDNGFDVRTETTSAGDGMLKESAVKEIYNVGEKLMSRAKYTWSGSSTLTKLEVTNDSGLTQKTEFEYDQYFNRTKIKEYDYGTTSPTLLRTTDIMYETGSGWINNRLLSLPKSVITTVGGVAVAKTTYEYDHGGTDAFLTLRGPNLYGTHDPDYNPETPQICTIICPNDPEATCENPGRDCDNPEYSGGYDPNTLYRGNATKVTAFADVTTETNAQVSETEYDILGNKVSSSVSCCNDITYGYDANYFAFMTSKTNGSSTLQQTTSATYNFNTGLMLTLTNENNQVTSYEYETGTLRLKKTTFPNGGYTQNEYSDKLITTTSDLLPSFVRSTTTLDSSHTVQSYNYFNGRGLNIRSAAQTPDGWSVSAKDYDKLGRVVKAYNPFYVSTPTGAIPSGTKFTEITALDGLGRTTGMKLQDNTTISVEFSDTTTIPSGFNKTFVTFTDQAAKKRRQVYDSFARIVRIDEPDASGNLGTVSSPNQPTTYEYDGNSNLSKITQSDGATTQERLFKYDALSRLTHEKQVEAIATLNDNGVKVTSGGLWTKVRKYNGDGFVVDGYDARGVNTHFTYDGLNRLSTISFSDGTPTVTYTYDQERSGYYNKGGLTRMETAEGNSTTRPDTPATATEYDYDKMGQVVKHRQSIGSQTYSLEYAYNLAGQMVSEKYPSGRTFTKSYDANGRLSGIADADRTYMSSLQYQSYGGMLNSFSLGNGTSQTFGFNDRLQTINSTLSKGSTVVQKYDYGYGQIDSNGNLDTAKNNNHLARIESYIGTSKQWTQKFSTDSLGRLSEAKEYRGDTNALSYKQKFDYDKFGNLYRKNSSNPTSGQETPLPYTPIEDSDISKSTNRFTSNTTYDDAGNVTADNKFRMMTFAYDANSRMIKASKTGVPDAFSTYDAKGVRVAEKVNDIWRFLIYDVGRNLVAEYGGLQATDDGGVKYVSQDRMGSTRTILNNTGVVQGRMDYQTFGGEIGANIGLRTQTQGFGGANNLRIRYGLTERDEASGLDHTWFRKYENQAGRWTSADPSLESINLGTPQSFNRYSFVENEPTNYIDPSGLRLYPGDVLNMQWRFWSAGCAWISMEGQSVLICSGVSPWDAPEPAGGGGDDGGGALSSTGAPSMAQETFKECVKRKMAALKKELDDLMDKNMVQWSSWTLGGLIAGGVIGALAGSGATLAPWLHELDKFNAEKWEPALKKAREECAKETS